MVTPSQVRTAGRLSSLSRGQVMSSSFTTAERDVLVIAVETLKMVPRAESLAAASALDCVVTGAGQVEPARHAVQAVQRIFQQEATLDSWSESLSTLDAEWDQVAAIVDERTAQVQLLDNVLTILNAH